MIKRTLIILFILTVSPQFVDAKTMRLDSLLTELDKAILNKEYQKHKEYELTSLKHRLTNKNLNAEEQYYLYSQLSSEYEFYRCDSARIYALGRLKVAIELNDKSRITDSKIQLASILFKAAMFGESIDLLASINEREITDIQRFNLYKAYYEAYVSWIDFYEDGYEDEELIVKLDYYTEIFLGILTEGTYEYASYHGIKYINMGELDKAETVLCSYLPRLQMGTRSYSIVTSVLSFLYERKNDAEQVKYNLVLSALSDIRGNIMENLSLRTLASILYGEGDLQRANNYIKKSMNDANYYNARIRNIQNSKVFSIIDKAYQADRAQQQKKLLQLLIIISVLSVGLIIGIFFIVLQVRKVSTAKKKISTINEELKEKNQAMAKTNQELAETSRIKDEYIGSSFYGNAEYIDKIDRIYKMANRRIATRQYEELRMLFKESDLRKERESMYDHFDETFLKLFPTFIQSYNNLFNAGDRTFIEDGKSLTVEMRIFALIRLGIHESERIAKFLNYSVNTINTYKTKVKNKSIIPNDQFEQKIMEIRSVE